MDRRPSKQLNPSCQKNGSGKRGSKGAVQKLAFNLPTDILELIITKLSSSDKAQAALVSKRWRSVVASVRKINKPPSLISLRPRNLYFDECSNLSYCITYNMCFPNAPERPLGEAYHSSNGWLLLFDKQTKETSLFCPQTRESVQLPKPGIDSPEIAWPGRKSIGAAFSAPPTSSNCVVFTMFSHRRDKTIETRTWRPSETTWKTTRFQFSLRFGCFSWTCVVVHNGMFYIMDFAGQVGEYDPERDMWRFLNVEALECTKYFTHDDWEQRVFMAEHNGDFYLVRTCGIIRPVVYMLGKGKFEWVKVKDLRGATFFAGFTNSYIRDDLPLLMSNCIYFPMLIYEELHCLMYSLQHNRYNSRRFNTKTTSFDPADVSRNGTIWVDCQPEDHVLGLGIIVNQNRWRTYRAICRAFEGS